MRERPRRFMSDNNTTVSHSVNQTINHESQSSEAPLRVCAATCGGLRAVRTGRDEELPLALGQLDVIFGCGKCDLDLGHLRLEARGSRHICVHLAVCCVDATENTVLSVVGEFGWQNRKTSGNFSKALRPLQALSPASLTACPTCLDPPQANQLTLHMWGSKEAHLRVQDFSDASPDFMSNTQTSCHSRYFSILSPFPRVLW